MPPVNRVYQQVLDAHRAALDRITERRGLPRLKQLYDQGQQEVLGRLKRAARGRAKDGFSAHVHRQVLGQLRQGQAFLARRMAGELDDLSKEAQVDALRGLTSSINKLEVAFSGTTPVLPIEEAARFTGVIDKRRTSLLKMHATSMARYGSHLVTKMEDQLALSLVTQETTEQAIDRIEQTADVEWWRAERIGRTELAWAANATHADGLADAAAELPDLMMRWNEHVSDGGTPLDDRVGDDSVAMHGQVAPPSGKFTMPGTTPKGEPISPSLVGQSWEFPPNRPNDRAVLAPWRPHWGIPGWEYRGGRRVPLR